MHADDIIIITGDIKGISYVAGLMTYDDYMTNLVDYASNDLTFVHDNAKSIFETKGTKDKISEIWLTANRTFQARFAYDREEIKGFLSMVAAGVTVEDEREIYLDNDLCSQECMVALFEMGLTKKGEEIPDRKYDYEKIPYQFKEGETINALNGHRYSVIKCFNQKDLLVRDTEYNQYIVCHDTNLYNKAVKNHPEIEPEIGIEWGHGDYLGEDVTKINFDSIVRDLDRSEGMEQLRNSMSRMFNNMKNALEEAPDRKVKDYVENCMDYVFLTTDEKEFDDMLDGGTYDKKYAGKEEDIHGVHRISSI